MKQTNRHQNGWTGKTRLALHLATAAAFSSIAVNAMVASPAIANTMQSCPGVVKFGSSVWKVQNAGKPWSCQSNGSELVLDVHAGDVWPGDIGRPQVWNRSQIVSAGSGTSNITVKPWVPAHFSFDVMINPGPANARQGMEIMELWCPCGSMQFFMQITTVSGKEYVQVITAANPNGANHGAHNTSNYFPGNPWFPSTPSVGTAPVLTRGVWHHVDVRYLDSKGQPWGYAIVTWDGATIYELNGRVGYWVDTFLEYQLGNYGEQPPAGSPDKDQVVNFKNPNFVGY